MKKDEINYLVAKSVELVKLANRIEALYQMEKEELLSAQQVQPCINLQKKHIGRVMEGLKRILELDEVEED
jgi:hypothetical protein